MECLFTKNFININSLFAFKFLTFGVQHLFLRGILVVSVTFEIVHFTCSYLTVDFSDSKSFKPMAVGLS